MLDLVLVAALKGQVTCMTVTSFTKVAQAGNDIAAQTQHREMHLMLLAWQLLPWLQTSREHSAAKFLHAAQCRCRGADRSGHHSISRVVRACEQLI
jgi:hypothetical protein